MTSDPTAVSAARRAAERVARHRGRLAVLAFAACALAPLGCVGWRTARSLPAAVVRERRPAVVRVVRVGGDTVQVSFPTVRGDSLVGSSDETARARRVAIAFADIIAIETRELNEGRTIGLIAGVTLAALVAYGTFLLIVLSGDHS